MGNSSERGRAGQGKIVRAKRGGGIGLDLKGLLIRKFNGQGGIRGRNCGPPFGEVI